MMFQLYPKRCLLLFPQELLKKTRALQNQVNQLLKQVSKDGSSTSAREKNQEERSTSLQRKRCLSPQTEDNTNKKKKKKLRPFDFNKYNLRHVALRIAYLGWDYHGFASQESTENTIEAYIFDALYKTKLMEDRDTANYSRCGRTDKGVSAFSQVIALDLRTNLLEGHGVIQRPGGTASERTGDKDSEIEYVSILNRVLPQEIRVLAWAPVDTALSARFNTKNRTYKYFFPKGDLNIALMREGAKKLIGEHDFRNFCKMDVGNGVVTFMRNIRSVTIEQLDNRDDGFQLYEITINGNAFLYHQIRCIMAILFLIGKRQEKIEIIDELLDIETNPCKPQYSMAVDYPLVLYDCSFDDINWIYDRDNHQHNIQKLQQTWTELTIRSTVVKRMLDGLSDAPIQIEDTVNRSAINHIPWNEIAEPMLKQSDYLTMGKPSKVHKPLMQRQKGESLEDRIEFYAKKRKRKEEQSEEET
ncbi:tRNA pseudouridine(38/39) synthase-like [Antedon mediterranea]|uniref:tRNA pseudouridine(38/39) synthase-like n=1 Tax=Antedon mediterranea TaxID=105859 RepID=UPI003AF97B9C